MKLTNWMGLAAVLALTGCPKANDTTDTDTDTNVDSDTDVQASLWDSLGGDAGVNALLDLVLANVAADPEINWMFLHTDVPALKVKFHDLLCSTAGGDCTYTGQDMATAHADMAITDAQFDAFVADLYAGLDTAGVPYSADPTAGVYPADSLLVVLASTRTEIVTDADGTGVLFNRIGGIAGVSAIITDFAGKVTADSTVNAGFANSNMTTLGQLFVMQMCDLTGGYCTYDGKTMHDAHVGMGITIDQFNTVGGHMMEALTDASVSSTDQATIMGALSAMCPDIVEVGTCPS